MSEAATDALLRHALDSIAVGSKSFASASRLFDPDTRRSAVLLYAWCRHCDDVIDGQQAGHDAVPLSPAEARLRLAELRARTQTAYLATPIDDPAFAALQAVVQRHGIAREEALDLLQGFAMDVDGQHYQTFADTLQYCYHVAGVVGLMMARIMGTQDPQVLDRACDLGLAMQLTNIARDLVDDAQVGRCYLPQQWLDEFGITVATLAEPRHRPALAVLATRLIDQAEPYYASAEAGLTALPWRSAWAVASAGAVYRRIGIRVRAAGAQAWDTRASTGKLEKLGALSGGLWTSLLRRLRRYPPRDPQLWTRAPLPNATARRAEPATAP